jgi:predicted Zn finger-like uncharacterized protein
MRLVCPNCEAKYEVPDDAIPDTGRDVQCANCGHAWFQMRHKPVGAADAAPAPVVAPDVAPVAAAVVAGDAQASADMTASAGSDFAPTPDPAPVQAPVVAESQSADALKAPAPYAVDDSVLAILREEAARETQARKSDKLPLESQPDLGIDAALSPTQKRVAMLNGDDAAGGKPSARRDLLPDVEEINSTLRPSEQSSEADDAIVAPVALAEKRGGFRSGFLVVMALAILATAIYIAAPQIGRLVPALADPLNAYVGFIDGMRLQLDGLMKSATVAINGETG